MHKHFPTYTIWTVFFSTWTFILRLTPWYRLTIDVIFALVTLFAFHLILVRPCVCGKLSHAYNENNFIGLILVESRPVLAIIWFCITKLNKCSWSIHVPYDSKGLLLFFVWLECNILRFWILGVLLICRWFFA